MIPKILIEFLTLFSIVNAVPYPQQPSLSQQQNTEVRQPVQTNVNPVPPNVNVVNNGETTDQTPAAASSPHISYMDKDGNTNVLENPAYNPDIYSTFIPQDAIQQYLNYFGGPVPYTAGILPPPTPMAVQTGYEGYIIPVQPQKTETAPAFLNFLKGIIPKVILAWILKFAAIALSAVGLVLFGGALTTAFCALTPLCTISFTAALPSLGRTIGEDSTVSRIKRAADFLQMAIEKYSELQRDDKSAFVRKIGRKY